KLALAVKDDQSSTTGNLTAAQYLVQTQGAFGIIEATDFTFGAYKYLNQQGVPVAGEAIDGPEWGQQPNTNMFSITPPSVTPVNGNYYTYTTDAKFLKGIGVKKLAGVVYGIESAIQGWSSLLQTTGPDISKCYSNESVPFGAVDFTATVLAIKA